MAVSLSPGLILTIFGFRGVAFLAEDGPKNSSGGSRSADYRGEVMIVALLATSGPSGRVAFRTSTLSR